MTGSIRKVAVFGATGQTGLCSIEHALKKGAEVTALVRTLSNMPADVASKITVIHGDSTIEDDVVKTVRGQDAVIVTLGTRHNLDYTTVMSDSLKLILKAMCQEGVKNISVCLSSFLFWDPERVPARFAEVNADHKRMLEALLSSEFEQLNWIAVHPPHIADEPSSGGQYQVAHGSSPGRTIPKWDLGEFMFDCLTSPEHYHQRCGLAYPIPPASA